MGLVDILNGMQNGPRGQRLPGNSSGSGGGMSPLTMALIGLLAYKALKHFGGSQAPAAGGAKSAPLPPGGTVPAGTKQAGGSQAGSLGDLLPGGLGGLLGGVAAGGVLSDGLNKLIKGFQDSGHGKEMQSWVGTGANQDISPKDLAHALGDDTIDALSKQTGLSRDDLLKGLSQQLPDLVDQLTPHGRPPSAEEAARLV
jgi:uncharacterized protein YidB (DUF937 family)